MKKKPRLQIAVELERLAGRSVYRLCRELNWSDSMMYNSLKSRGKVDIAKLVAILDVSGAEDVKCMRFLRWWAAHLLQGRE